jgi:DNA (cytosine-5)-methyltransferase 1
MDSYMAGSKLVAVDLFSGGGGLTAGLKMAGFSVCAAVELDKAAAETYNENHKEVILFQKDIKEITAIELLKTSPSGKIDLIAACPPCQGFSSLTSKYKTFDSRNKLINEFARLVREIKPTTIMMENVPGLEKKGGHLFTPVINEFKELGYIIDFKVLEVADYGIPQRRKRLVVLGMLGSSIKIPQPTHSMSGENGKKQWKTVKDAIGHMPHPIDLKTVKTLGRPTEYNWHVTRNLAPINVLRLKSLKAGASRTAIPQELRPVCHKSDIGFSNVYGRMAWDKPSPTITGGCTTLSKGRFGHPAEIRTISVREAALLQTFPKNYKFSTEFIDKACNIIGNALPPQFAKVMSKACMDAIHREKK